MATDDTNTPDPASRFGWGSTAEIRMLGPDGEPLTPEEVAAVNKVLAWRAWAADNPEEVAEMKARGEIPDGLLAEEPAASNVPTAGWL